jgi:peptidoglycan/xylan/chitin deacetylase (PgdA/CDA1 family)
MNTRTIILLALAWSGVAAAEPAQVQQWPGGAQTAVSLTYDDALDSHLDNAAPELKRHGLRGTFYLVASRPPVAERLAEWRALAADGFELGNHTLNHGCSKSLPDRDWVPAWDDLDHVTVTQLQRDIRTANTLLTAIDGQQERTFASPCYDQFASGENYLEAIQGDFFALRDLSHGMAEGAVVGWAPVEASGSELIAFIEANTRPGALLVLVFHGVGGDYLAVTAQAHAELVSYLAAHRDTYWTDSYLNIMRHVLGAAP